MNAADPDSNDTGMFDFYVEQLETYLDGELPADEASAVRRRLAEEPAYAAALDRLGRDRRARVAALDHDADPADAEAALRLTRRAAELAAIDRPATTLRLAPRWLGLAAAAALLIAFGVGLLGGLDLARDRAPTAEVRSNPAPAVNANTTVVSDPADRDESE